MINKNTKTLVEIPVISIENYTYNGQAQGPIISTIDSELITVTGNTMGTNAGQYSFILSLVDKETCIWSNHSTADRTYTFSIAKANYPSSVSVAGYTYAGTKSTPSVTNNPENGAVTYYGRSTLGGTSTAWSNVTSTTYDAGTRYIYAVIAETTNYNQCTTPETCFNIAPTTGVIIASSNSILVDRTTPYQDITVSYNGDANWYCISSDTDVATVTKQSSTSCRIAAATGATSPTGLGGGSTTVTIVAEATASCSATSTIINVSSNFIYIYGVEWDGSSSPQMTRTDAAMNFTDPNPVYKDSSTKEYTTGSSPFDNLYPWSGMVIEERTAGTMVKIPKFWFKLSVNTTTNALKLQVANGPAEGFSVSPAHIDRGDGIGERDYMYVGRYHCSSSDYKSTTGVKPKVSIGRSAARSNISSLGTNIWQYDYTTLTTIRMLYIVEFANWNSQATIGYGCAPTGSTSAVRNMGYTDSMTYHTGTDRTSRTTYGGTQYRWIEGLWDNCYDWCDGIYFNNTYVYSILRPSYFSDTTYGTQVGTRSYSGGYISGFWVSSVNNFNWFMYPSVFSGTSSTYICDVSPSSTYTTTLCVGGTTGQSQDVGLFYFNYKGASDTSSQIGCRLIELP